MVKVVDINMPAIARALVARDRGYVLSNGRIVGQGTTDALHADAEMMSRYLAVTWVS